MSLAAAKTSFEWRKLVDHKNVERFFTRFIEDLDEGWGGLELLTSPQADATVIARLIYWDATGRYGLETFGGEVPLALIDALIANRQRTR